MWGNMMNSIVQLTFWLFNGSEQNFFITMKHSKRMLREKRVGLFAENKKLYLKNKIQSVKNNYLMDGNIYRFVGRTKS